MTKLIAMLGALLAVAGAQAADHKLVKLWETVAALKVPESVRFDAKRKALYVSDSSGKKVFVVKDGKATVHLDDRVLKGPNGLYVHKGALYVLDDNSLNRVEKDGNLTVLASGMPGGVDGLENVGGDDFLV